MTREHVVAARMYACLQWKIVAIRRAALAGFLRGPIAMVLALHAAAAPAQTAVTLQPPNAAGSVAGTLPGEAGVPPSGASTYVARMPIPPGTAGVQPDISLRYDSQRPDGLLGLGWSIDGLSYVKRCRATLATFGYVGKVALDANDRYCLDDRPLVGVSGTYGATAEYRTEIDSFSRIKSTGSNAANGPDTWQVEAKGGRILTYGATADSNVQGAGSSKPLLWAVNRVEDRRGNYYAVYYDENTATGEHYPKEIRYTGNGSNLTPYAAVRFEYEAAARPDQVVRYAGGVKSQILKRLAKVSTWMDIASDGTGGTLVQELRISYQTSATSKRSLVSSVQWCGPSNQCLPGTTFAWHTRSNAANNFNAAGSGVWNGPTVSFEAGDSQTLDNALKSVKYADLNGDGRTDLFKSLENGTWSVCLSTGSGFNCQTWTGPNVASKNALTGDFNGDGLNDLLLTSSPWQVCFSTGSSFNCENRPGVAAASAVILAGKSATFGYVVGDLTGDGRDDVLVRADAGNQLCASTDTGFSCTAYTANGYFDPKFYAYMDPESPCSLNISKWAPMMGDFDGDGRTDVLMAEYLDPNCQRIWPANVDNTLSVCLAGDAASTCTAAVTGLGSVVPVVQPPKSVVGDLNGDGLADFFVPNLGSAWPGGTKVCLSTGAGTVDCQDYSFSNFTLGAPFVADFDGDGRADSLQDGVCQIVNGTLDCTTAWTVSTVGTNELGPIFADFNGDARIDLGFYNKSTGQWRIALIGASVHDVLASVTNGLGHVTEFDYRGIHDSSIYTAGSAATYPQRNVPVGINVVSQMRRANAVGGWLTTDYQYEANRQDLRGRVALGFAKLRALDAASSTTAQTTASQSFPYIGMPTEQKTSYPSSNPQVVLNLATNTLASFTTAGTARYAYVSKSDVTRRDLNGALLPRVITEINAGGIDAFGNVTSSTETVTSGNDTFTTLTTNTYDNREVPWLVGLLTRMVVQKTATLPDTPASVPVLTLGACSSVSPVMSPATASMTCTLGNRGQVAASTISYSGPAGATIAGPGSCAALSANCGTVTVTAASPGTYSGTLQASPAPTGPAAMASVNLTVNATPPSLALGACLTTNNTTSPTSATLTCTLSNSGQTAASAVAYSTAGATTVSGPGSCSGGNSNCGTVTVTTGTAPGTYSGTLAATPTPSGTAASASINLTVKPTAPNLSLSGCTATNNTTSPTPAVMTCTLGNSGQTAATSVAYASAGSTSVTGPGSCAASTGNCGTVTVTTGTAAGNYAGTLSATPTPAGTAASTAVNLTVKPTPPSLTLGGCQGTSNTTSPTAATLSCTLGNTGQSAATSVTYGTAGGTTVAGPSSCSAGNGNCGTVTVTTSTSPGTYAGTLSATPTPSGTAASTSISLVVKPTPPSLTLSCSSNSPVLEPSAATMTCTVGNSGQTAVSSIAYSIPFGTTRSGGPTTCAGSTANCGSFTLSTATTPGTYSGTVTVTPTPAGNAASQAVSLVVNNAYPVISVSPTSLAIGTVAKGAMSAYKTITVSNTGTLAATLSWSLSYTSGTQGTFQTSTNASLSTCLSGAPVNGSCTISVRYVASCTGGSRAATLTVSGNEFSSIAVPITAATSSSGQCL
ncbi:FG-GAP-like repeat-containing protein [Piscinibacter sp.]|uniref:FG-GAP-like repeat-containing protein n=2 Tax=Piscinibacter sp. TaxID=1903157 RepID=UPI0011D5F9A2|nr:MAG: hypothetical protein E6Q93_04090 [Burkholderiaceae bacterium]